jgi:hypothetical protein
MAVIAFHTSQQTARIQARLQALLAVLHDKLDGFVDRRIRLAAAQAEQVRHDTPRPDRPVAVAAKSWALDPGIVSDAIPAFFVGRNIEGFWVARDVKGRIGGMFLLENSATSFARNHSRPAGCAIIYPSKRFELDLENNGNPMVAPLASLKRVTMRPLRRMAALPGKWRKRPNAG